MPETTLTSTSVLLFGLYTIITIGSAFAMSVIGRGRVTTMGEKAKNDAVATVTSNFSSLLEDARSARQDLNIEREKRAELRGEFNGLLRQIETLKGDMDKIRHRLEQVEGEKKKLEGEKADLEKTLDLKSVEYQKLMTSIQGQIDNAVAAVRAELEAHYGSQIKQLEEKIREKDAEISLLKSVLKEKSNEPQDNPIPINRPGIAADTQSPDAAGTGSDGSSDGNNDKPAGNGGDPV